MVRTSWYEGSNGCGPGKLPAWRRTLAGKPRARAPRRAAAATPARSQLAASLQAAPTSSVQATAAHFCTVPASAAAAASRMPVPGQASPVRLRAARCRASASLACTGCMPTNWAHAAVGAQGAQGACEGRVCVGFGACRLRRAPAARARGEAAAAAAGGKRAQLRPGRGDASAAVRVGRWGPARTRRGAAHERSHAGNLHRRVRQRRQLQVQGGQQAGMHPGHRDHKERRRASMMHGRRGQATTGSLGRCRVRRGRCCRRRRGRQRVARHDAEQVDGCREQRHVGCRWGGKGGGGGQGATAPLVAGVRQPSDRQHPRTACSIPLLPPNPALHLCAWRS